MGVFNIHNWLDCSFYFHSTIHIPLRFRFILEWVILVTNFWKTLKYRKKANPYDKAVAEATFKLFKTEFIHSESFDCLGLNDYVNWFNNIRIHGSLGYLSPVEYKLAILKKVVCFLKELC